MLAVTLGGVVGNLSIHPTVVGDLALFHIPIDSTIDRTVKKQRPVRRLVKKS